LISIKKINAWFIWRRDHR